MRWYWQSPLLWKIRPVRPLREYFYYAPWFILLQLLQAVNLLAMFLQGGYFKRISKGSLIFHGALVFIWLGAAVTHYAGVTGIMHIREGETVDRMMRDEGAGMGNASLPFLSLSMISG